MLEELLSILGNYDAVVSARKNIMLIKEKGQKGRTIQVKLMGSFILITEKSTFTELELPTTTSVTSIYTIINLIFESREK